MKNLYRLSLFDNAMDSLNEALIKYQSARNGKIGDLKFSVLLSVHFIELLFKNYLYEIHPLLIYKNPFAKNIFEQQTINLWDAVNFIENAEREDLLDDQYFDLKKDLEWLKKLRNRIEHYDFVLDIEQTKITIGRTIQAACSFHNDYSKESIIKKVCPENYNIFKEIIDDFDEQKKIALKAANEANNSYWCSCCSLKTLTPIDNNKLKCTLCDNEMKLVTCLKCENEFLEEETEIFESDEDFQNYVCKCCISNYMED